MNQMRNFGEEEKEEKLEFLKREEIRTMAKDIAKLREIESQKERERIATLKPKEEIKAPVPPAPTVRPVPPAQPSRPIPSFPSAPPTPPAPPAPSAPSVPPTPIIPQMPSVPLIPPILGKKEEIPEKKVPEKKKEVPVGLIPKISKKPSLIQKILVRTIFLLILFLILGFFYWFFAVRQPPIEKITPPEEEISEITIPPSLILVNATETLEMATLEELPSVLSQFLEKTSEVEGFARILVKNTKENRLVSLEDLSSAFQTETPQEIFTKLDPDFTFVVYSQTQGKRTGLIGKVKEKSGLDIILKDWEQKIEKDGVFLSGEKIQTFSQYFKTSTYQEVEFRFLTISKDDLGICYALFDDYFVFATSFESMEKIIDELKIGELTKKIGQIFIIGFDGKSVTPELEKIFKEYKPGGVLLLQKNIENAEQLKNLTQALQELSLKETGLPLFIALDQEGGIISRIFFTEEKISQSEIKNSSEAYQIGKVRGGELKELGINLNLSPVADMADRGDFLFERSFQKSPAETGNLAKSLILGQNEAGILTALKHFPGYGGIASNPEETLVEKDTVPEISQFEIAMEANPEFVMTSNVIYKNLDPSLPFTFSPASVQFLKNNLGSEALVISDDLAQNYLLEKFSLKDTIIKPILAGVDVVIFSGWQASVSEALEIFYAAVRNGEIPESKINEKFTKITKLKQNLVY